MTQNNRERLRQAQADAAKQQRLNRIIGVGAANDVKAVRWALIGLIEEHSHHRTCAICGSPVEAYVMGDYALAECPKCQRVLGMEDVGYRERIAQARAMFAAKVLG